MAKAKLLHTQLQPGTFAAITTQHVGNNPILKRYGRPKAIRESTLTTQQALSIAAGNAWNALDDLVQDQWRAISGVTSLSVSAGGSGYDATDTIQWPFTNLIVLITNGGLGYADSPVMELTASDGTVTKLPLIAAGGAILAAQYLPQPNIFFQFDLEYPWKGATPTATITGGGGSGATVSVNPSPTAGYIEFTLTNAGSGYNSYPVVESQYGDTIANMCVSDGTMIGYIGTGTATGPWYAEPGLSVSGAGTSAAQLTAGFYAWPYQLPTANAVVGGGAVTGATLTFPGNQTSNLPTPVVLGPGTGATLSQQQIYENYEVTSKAGIVSTLIGRAAYTHAWARINAFHAFPLRIPTTDFPPEFVEYVTFGDPFIYEGQIATEIEFAMGEHTQVWTITHAGSGYTSPPTAVISSADGVNMTTQAFVNNGGVQTLQILDPGHNYQTGDTATFTGGGGSGATATLQYAYPQVGCKIYLRKPKGISRYANIPATKQLAGYWFVSSGGNLPDLTAAWTRIFGGTPPDQAPIGIDWQLVNLNNGMTSTVHGQTAAALGGIRNITDIVSPTGLTTAPTIDWLGAVDPGATYALLLTEGVITSAVVALPGSGGSQGSYGFVGYDYPTYSCQVNMYGGPG